MLRSLSFLFLLPLSAIAADALTPGKVELYPTYSAVGLDIPYEGDDNRNGSASFVWRPKGEAQWRNGVDLTIDRQRRRMWGSIWPLEQGQAIEVRITFADPDAPARMLEDSTTVRRLILAPRGGRQFHVAPTGADSHPGTADRPLRTLARAAALVRPGDEVLVQTGVYAEADLGQRLKGTQDRPIVFAAAPGAKPVLDSSLVLAPRATNWTAEGGGVFSASLDLKGRSPGYVAQDDLRSYRFASLAELRASQITVCRGWFHDAKAGKLHVRTGSDRPPDACRYNVSRDDYAFHLTGSRHVVVRGFTMRNYGAVGVRLSEGACGCVLSENIITNVPGGVFLKGENTCDNAIWNNTIVEQGLNDFPWELLKNSSQARQGIFAVAGRGTSICNNRIGGWFDCVCPESWKNPEKLALNRDCDVMFNDLFEASDDAIEADGGGVNMRIHGNHIRQCHTALSLAPVERGPLYCTRNDTTFFNLMFKLNVGGCTSLGWTYCYHNSGYCLTSGADGGTAISFPPGIPCANKVFLNNAIVCNEWSVRAGRPNFVLDHNCYFHVPGKPPRKFQWEKKSYPTIAAFSRAAGQERKGLYADPQFNSAPDVGRLVISEVGKQGLGPQLDGKRTGDLRLKSGSRCIDRGVVIRGINEDHHGSAPDIGAFESSRAR